MYFRFIDEEANTPIAFGYNATSEDQLSAALLDFATSDMGGFLEYEDLSEEQKEDFSNTPLAEKCAAFHLTLESAEQPFPLVVVDLEEKIIEVTDLEQALEQASAFSHMKHNDSQHEAFCQNRQAYWSRLHYQLMILKAYEQKYQ